MSEPKSTGMILVERATAALLELAAHRPASLGETRDLIAALLGTGDGEGSLVEMVSGIASDLGNPMFNPTLAVLPGPAVEILQTVTDFHTAVYAEDCSARIGAEAVEAIEQPWAVRTVAAFHAEHQVVPDLEGPGDGERAPVPEPDEGEELPTAA
ncbi:hypothetical protein [Kitasatospora cinereorecta]|uniref:Uncharacterized protein n=1 Tax=Kitasatospora cinereorecta TaxID=285560 RepID=A0ABW0VLM8_9ACTN